MDCFGGNDGAISVSDSICTLTGTGTCFVQQDGISNLEIGATYKMETKITDFGLNGKIIRLGPTQSIETAVQTELKNNPKTIPVRVIKKAILTIFVILVNITVFDKNIGIIVG